MLNFVRVAAGTPKLSVADCEYNVNEIIRLAKEAEAKQVRILALPELCITGYSCEDLFFQSSLIKGAEEGLSKILDATKNIDMIIAIGIPIGAHNQLFNCAAICHLGKIMGLIPKMYLPNSGEFGERRWFSGAYDLPWTEISCCGQTVPMGNDILFDCPELEAVIGVEICQDLWEPIPPSTHQALAGANLILNLTASNDTALKHNRRCAVVAEQSRRTISGYVFAASGIWESGSSVVFSGHNIICENGMVLAEGERFQVESELIVRDIDIELIKNKRRRENGYMACYHNSEKRDYRVLKIPVKSCASNEIIRHIAQNPYIPEDNPSRDLACEDIFKMQAVSLMRRLTHINSQKCVLAISGGLDSTLALFVTVKAMELLGHSRENIIGLIMPGFGTTNRSLKNAFSLAENLGITRREIDIKPACIQHFKDIEHDPDVYNVVFENTQARERTQIAMDIANKEGALMVGTSNLSEIALGFSTFGGDHMSMYNVNCGVPKTIVRIMAGWIADKNMFGEAVSETIRDILAMPISPELLPPSEFGDTAQITEDILGPYEINDFFMYHMIDGGFEPCKIIELAFCAFEGKYSREKLILMLKNFYRLFFTNQYKRSCAPDGPKVVTISLLAKGDLKMPSDSSYKLWLRKLEEYEKIVYTID